MIFPNSYSTSNTILVGDLHGNFWAIASFIRRYGIFKSLFIQVGDFGLGFDRYDESNLRHIDEALEDSQNKVIVIRGNHDDPSYWFEKKLDLKNIWFIPDYTKLNINGENFLFVGGAVSIDKGEGWQGKISYTGCIF